MTWAPDNEAYNQIEKNILSILEGERPDDHEGQLVWDLYHAYLDWDTRDAIGIEPLQTMVNKINEIQTLEELNDFICDPAKNVFLDTLISCSNSANVYDSSKYLTYLRFDDFILQSPKEYDGFSEMGARIYMAEREKLIKLLGRIGIDDKKVKEMLDATLDVEGELVPYGDYGDDSFIYTLDEMSEMTKEFPLTRFLDSRGYGKVQEFYLAAPDSLYCLGEYYTKEHLEDLKSYLIIRYARNIMMSLDQEARTLGKNYDNMLYGTQQATSVQHDACRKINTEMPEALGRVYMEKYEDKEKKERVEQLAEKIIEEYCEMLQEEEWMQEETRKQAIEKLKTMNIQVFYPDKWQDYSELDLEGKNYLECIEAIREYEHKQDVNKIGAKVDRAEWNDRVLLDTNAYYSPMLNRIMILVGMTEDALYKDTTDEELYGTLGYVVGHEISHAFDPNGAMYDKNGNLRYWWTEEDWQVYYDKMMNLLEYYNSMTVWGQTKVDGAKILNEAVADQTSVKVLLRLAKQKEEFDYEKFFTTLAEGNRALYTYEFEQNVFATDNHPLPHIRVNAILQQFEEFYETFDIKEGDGMYLKLEDRIVIW